jgi:hypothetical protein
VKAPTGLVKLLEDSLRWSRDHKGETYKHALPCEECLAEGLAIGIASYTREMPHDVLNRYKEKIAKEPQPKKRTIKRPVKKRVVTRRIKK